MDTNREAGTISTGDYGKGDSAALFVAPKTLLGGSGLSDKTTVEGVIRKALSQKARLTLASKNNQLGCPQRNTPGADVSMKRRIAVSENCTSWILMFPYVEFGKSSCYSTACLQNLYFLLHVILCFRGHLSLVP